MAKNAALVAVSQATYWLDKPFSYLIPEHLTESVKVGCRVYVPFSSSNRLVEAFVLKVVSDCNTGLELKTIVSVIDADPVISSEQIQLSYFMRDRFFCTIYDSLKAMVPAGVWLKSTGKGINRSNSINILSLSCETDIIESIILSKEKRAPQQASILRLLNDYGDLSEKDVLAHSGASKNSLNTLIKNGLVCKSVFEQYSVADAAAEHMDLPVLSEEQNAVFNGIADKLSSNTYSSNLIFGVTGSGKTSIYAHLIKYTVNLGKSVIYLLPEIGLTPQVMRLFKSYFGDNIAILHSSLTVAQRYSEWQKVKNGKIKIVIGTRSAVFAPVDNLGLLIIDEEHDKSYKSDSNPRYNAKTIAKYLCYKHNACLIMGTATPSLDTMYETEHGDTNLFRLTTRYNRKPLPDVLFSDMKKEVQRGNVSPISSLLKEEISRNLMQGEQTLLFINRRGTNKLVSCNCCGYIFECPKCSVGLTYHGEENRLICHYCGYSRPVPKICPECGGDLDFIGIGTQKVADEIEKLFPGNEIVRIDSDTVMKAGSHQLLFDRFANNNSPFMIGTQMITKGLDFGNVTLVGIIDADQVLYSGNYTAAEDTFSLITQVIGRSGRSDKPGRAVIQTFTPENEVLRLAAKQDYMSFYRSEIGFRQMHSAPPFRHLYSIMIVGSSEPSVLKACTFLRSLVLNKTKNTGDISVLGPAPMMVYKINNKFRYRINILSKDSPDIRKLISEIVIDVNQNRDFANVHIYADNNPTV